MLPILLKIGPITLRTYGLMVSLGFVAGILLAAARARKRGFDPEAILDLSFYMILAGILGGRILYIIQFPDYYLAQPLRMLKIWEGGLVFYGGLALAAATAAIYLRTKRMPMFETGDLMAPSIALGYAVGRLGCLAAGCCYGRPFDGPWAVTFHDPFCLAQPLNTPLHPTQIYLSLSGFAAFFMLLWLDRHRRFPGMVFTAYLGLYALGRFWVEFFRGDERGSFFGLPLSSAQGIGLIVLIITAVLWISLSRRHKAAARPS